jgi:hypothetical protein
LGFKALNKINCFPEPGIFGGVVELVGVPEIVEGSKCRVSPASRGLEVPDPRSD